MTYVTPAASSNAASTKTPNSSDAAAFAQAMARAKSNLSGSRGKPDYTPPGSWNAQSPKDSPHPGNDPLNVVISANSNVSMNDLMGAMQSNEWLGGAATNAAESLIPVVGGLIPSVAPANQPWEEVGNGTNVLAGQGVGIENANVNGSYQPQDISARQGGLATEGNLFTDVNHFRAWHQNGGAWFIAAGEERFNLGIRYHQVTSYNAGRDNLVANIEAAAQAKGWKVTVTPEYNLTNTKPDSNGVSNDGKVDVLTITA